MTLGTLLLAMHRPESRWVVALGIAGLIVAKVLQLARLSTKTPMGPVKALMYVFVIVTAVGAVTTMAHFHIGKLIINVGISGLILTFLFFLLSISKSNARSKLRAAILIGQAVIILTGLLLRMNRIISAETLRMIVWTALAAMVILIVIIKNSKKRNSGEAV
jgi:hypothetical protein